MKRILNNVKPKKYPHYCLYVRLVLTHYVQIIWNYVAGDIGDIAGLKNSHYVEIIWNYVAGDIGDIAGLNNLQWLLAVP